MATLIYKGPGCRRLTKGTMITVLPKSNSNQITRYDIGNALEKLGFEHDEIMFCSNTRDWETTAVRDGSSEFDSPLTLAQFFRSLQNTMVKIRKIYHTLKDL